MKKWFFVLGILGCSLLFFLSGTLLGYLTSEKLSQTSTVSEKPARKPSKKLNPVIGRVLQTQSSLIPNRSRTPTPAAVSKAMQYKAQIAG